jgi:hypothetical protein
VQARVRTWAWVASAAALLALGWAVVRSPGWLADAALADRLMPDEVANKVADRVNGLLRGPPATDAPSPDAPAQADTAADAELATLRTTYPGDPRALYVSALWELHQGHDARGEGFLRQGLRDSSMLTRAFGSRDLETDMRRHLARSDLRRGDEAQARRDLAPVCGLAEPVLKEAWALELCNPSAGPPPQSP